MARVIHDGVQALVADVVVHPDYQKQGIGSKLMQHVMTCLRELSGQGRIMVNLSAALGKENFYAQFGFFVRPNVTQGSGMSL